MPRFVEQEVNLASTDLYDLLELLILLLADRYTSEIRKDC
jgi:hypothetical protein